MWNELYSEKDLNSDFGKRLQRKAMLAAACEACSKENLAVAVAWRGLGIGSRG